LIMKQKEQKRKVIITFSKAFPPGHSKVGQPTGFESKLKAGTKIHTIRADAKGWWDKCAEAINSGRKYLSLREWVGRPYNSEQRILGERDKIGLQTITMTYSSEDELPQAWVDGKKVPVEQLAKNDGLAVEDFVEWFFSTPLYKSNTFEGKIIHLTDFRY